MTKSQKFNREVKKPASLSPKEKKAAKRLKKQAAEDPTPLVAKAP